MPYSNFELLLIDDHPIMHEATSSLLEGIFKGVRITTAATYKQTCEILHNRNFDLVVSDLMIGDIGAQDLVDELETRSNQAKLAFFSALDESELAVQYLKGRGHLFVSKGMASKEITFALQGFMPSHQSIQMAPQNEFQSAIQVVGNKPLTLKQVAIMDLLVTGATGKEIAREIGLSSDTVRAHIKEAYRRLDSDNRASAVNAYIAAKRISEMLQD